MENYAGLGSGLNLAPSLQERYESSKQVATQTAPDLLDVTKSAAESWLVPSIARQSQRERDLGSVVDRQWQPSDAHVKSATDLHLNDRELDYLSQSVSEDQWNTRLSHIHEDRERAKVFTDSGLGGKTLSFAVQVLDPAVMLLGGAGGVAKAGTLSNFARGALSFGAVDAAAEALVVEADLTRDWEDVLYAGAMSGAVGGVAAAYFGKQAAKGMRQPVLDLDDALNRAQDTPLLALPAPEKMLALPAPGQTTISMQDSIEAATERMLQSGKPTVAGFLEYKGDLTAAKAMSLADQNDLMLRKASAQAELDKLQDQLSSYTGNPWILSDLQIFKRMEDTLQSRITASERLGSRQVTKEALDKVVQKQAKIADDLKAAKASKPKGSGRKLSDARRERLAEIKRLEDELAAANKKIDQYTGSLKERADARRFAGDIEMLRKGKVPASMREEYELLRQERTRLIFEEEGNRLTRETKATELQREIKDLDDKLDALISPPEQAAARYQSVVRERLIIKKGEPDADVPKAPEAEPAASKAEVKPDAEEVPPAPITQDNAGLFNTAREGRVPDLLRTVYEHAGQPPAINLGKYVGSVGSRLSNSVFQSIRGLNSMLNSLAQGGQKGMSAAHKQALYYGRALNKFKPAQEATEEFFKNSGIPFYKRFTDESVKALDEFNNQIVLAIKGIEPTGQHAELVKKAAKAIDDTFKESLTQRKMNGVRGFEHIEADSGYFSLLYQNDKLKATIGLRGVEDTTEMIAGAYLNGAILRRMKDQDAAAKIARKIAEAQIERTMNSDISSITRVKAILDGKTRSFMSKHMKEAGVTEEEMELWFKAMEAAEDKLTMSNRAKTSFGADMTYEYNGIRMVDVINTDPDVALRYAREASADASLASVGFKSKHDVENVLVESQRRIQNTLNRDLAEGKRTLKEINELTSELEKEVKLIRGTVKQLYGESLEAGADGKIPRWVPKSRLARGISSVMALSWNGLASIPELGNVIARQGLFTVLSQVPNFKIRPSKFKDNDPILEAWQSVTGMYGHTEGWFHGSRKGTDVMAELGESISNIEKGVRSVGEAQQLMSGFKHIQHGWEELNLRSMIHNMDKAARKGEVSAKMYRQFAEFGMEPADLDKVMDYLRNNRKQINGFDVADLDAIPYELRDLLGASMLRQLNSAVQKQFIGEVPEIMNREFGRLMFQFLTFPVVAIEKQLLAGNKVGTSTFVAATAWQAGLAYGTYMGYTWAKGKLSADEDDYYEKALSPEAVAYGTMSRMGGLGSLSLLADAAATIGMVPDELMGAPGKVGAQSMIKAPSAVTSILRPVLATGGLGRQGLNEMFGDGADPDAVDRHLRALYRSTPIINSAAIGIGFAALKEVND